MTAIPMMELKELKLKNFKSFKKAKIPFKRGFTVIVGPNGSGKSNILDALLFVLGETSMKSLRASRITDLINNATQENYGKVELKIKKGKETTTISRTIDRKGKSICRINDERKSLSELTSLVSELGLRNSYNFVAQGDVTRIIEMSPEQRRTIIDELAGIKEFELKREEAQKNLDKVNEKIKDVNLVLHERLTRLEELEKERKQAERYKELTERKDSIKATILKKEIDAINAEVKKAKEKLKKNREALEKKEKEAEKIKKKIADLENKNEALSNKILAEQEKAFEEFGKQIEELKAEDRVLEEQILSHRTMLSKLEQQENELAEELKALLEQKRAERKSVSAYEKELGEVEKESLRLEQRLRAVEEEAKDVEERIASIEAEISKIEANRETLQEKLMKKRAEHSEIKKENEMRQLRIKELKEKIQSLKDEQEKFAKLKTHIKLLESKNLEAMLKQLKERENALIGKEKELLARIAQTREAIEKLKKASSLCPVCESTLNERKKKILIEKKNNEIKRFEAQHKDIIKRLKEITEQIGAVEKEIEKLNELKREYARYENVANELKELANALENEKAQIKDLGGLEREIGNIEKELERLKAEKELKLAELKELEVSEELSLRTKATELKHRKEFLKNNIKHAKQNIEKLESDASRIRARIESIEKEKEDIAKEIEEKSEKIEKLKEKLLKLETEKTKKSESLRELINKKESIATQTEKMRHSLDSFESEKRLLEREINEARVDIGKNEVRLADLEEELKSFQGVRFLMDLSLKELKKELPKIEKELGSIGPVNLRAAESIKEEEESLLEVKEKIQKLERERDAVIDMINKIEVKKKEVFMNCFNSIRKNFAEMFYNFFEGNAELKLTDYEDPSNAGLIIEAKYKGKALQSIDSMSGGEKSLTALAFIFAILLYKPAPLYVFDEADAALDEINSAKVAKAIKEFSKKAQIIAITHNHNIIRDADQIIGVTLAKDKSSVIGLDLKQKLLENA